MLKLKAIVVDDEPLARARLARLAGMCGLQVIGQGENGVDACQLAADTDAHILFLDIDMPRKNGIDAAFEITQMNDPPCIVFCTAYDEYAIKAFESGAMAYLLKPISIDDMSAAVEKAGRVSRAQLETIASMRPEEEFVSYVNEGILKRAPLSAFVAFYSLSKHVYAVNADQQETLVDITLKQLEDRYVDTLIRVHRGAVVNRNKISEIRRVNDGRYEVVVEGGFAVQISRRHLKRVKECFV